MKITRQQVREAGKAILSKVPGDELHRPANLCILERIVKKLRYSAPSALVGSHWSALETTHGGPLSRAEIVMLYSINDSSKLSGDERVRLLLAALEAIQ